MTPRIDLRADLNAEDDEGRWWTLLRNAVVPAAVAPGAVMVAGMGRMWSVVRVDQVDDDNQVHFVEVPTTIPMPWQSCRETWRPNRLRSRQRTEHHRSRASKGGNMGWQGLASDQVARTRGPLCGVSSGGAVAPRFDVAGKRLGRFELRAVRVGASELGNEPLGRLVCRFAMVGPTVRGLREVAFSVSMKMSSSMRFTATFRSLAHARKCWMHLS